MAFDPNAWRALLTSAVSQVGTTLAAFLPNLLAAALILLLGWLLSRALEAIAARALRTVGLDGFATRLGVSDVLERAEIRLTVSQLVAKLIFWFVLLTFLLSSLETLGLSAVTETIDRMIAFIPNVIGAVLIGIGGLVLARVASAVVRSAAAAADFASATRLGFAAQALLSGLVLVLAAEQLGVATDIFVLPFTVALATAGFGIGLAFALGSSPVITHILAGHFLKQSLPRDTSVEIEGRRGVVERVGAVETLLRSDDYSWTVPNGQLLEQIVVR